MKAIDLLFRIAHGVLRFVVVLTASLMLIYGAYVIFDTLCVERNAFVSSELLKYKPTVTSVETVEYSMQDLQKINDDVVGWLEIEDTHIDYPVVQGEDELEYANKDPFGNHSITGSIYLSSGNDRNFDDFYNVIYGHNMDAGAMFGDIAKYLDKDYFEAHRTGTLYTNDKSYEFKIYAVLETDAYQSNIYSSNVTNKEDSKNKIDYINSNLIYGEARSLDSLSKVLIFSTCESAETNGRVVVVADAVLSDKVLGSGGPVESGQLGSRRAVLAKVDYWALLNLFCLIGTFFTLFPLFFIAKKYKMFGYSKKVNKLIKDDYEFLVTYITGEDGSDHLFEVFLRTIRRFRFKIKAGLLIEVLMLVGAAYVFFVYEDITKKIVFVDRYTPFMIAAFAISLLADIICFTYRGIELPEIINDIIEIGV